jgi:hypothetical protein
MFRFCCPETDAVLERPLSALRAIERLPGAAHPAVYRVSFACAVCGGEHPALVTERDLDTEAVAPREGLPYHDVLTGRTSDAADELRDAAERHLRRGIWPWSFYCACEHEVRPGYPSRIVRLEPAVDGGLVGVVVRCAVCDGHSVNLVSARHLDEPFYHDAVLRFVERPLAPGAGIEERFRHELHSAAFDRERNRFAA